MKKAFRWGIVGPGRIARKFAASLPYSSHGVLQAVASTDAARAKAFASEFGAVHAFGAYRDMAESGEIDAVYIATPHSSHFENSILFLNYGIPVLCEKPLTPSLFHTQHLVELASKKNVFLLEGMWTHFLPHFQQAVNWVESGRIGQLVHIQADFAYQAERDPANRLFNPELAGGVVKDIGIYPIAFFIRLLGSQLRIQKMGSRSETGVDEHVIFQGMNAHGVTFQSMVSFRAFSEVEAWIVGTKGRIRLSSQWLRPVEAWLFPDGKEPESWNQKVPGFGFQFEADEVAHCVEKGKIESSRWTWKNSIETAAIISEVESIEM